MTEVDRRLVEVTDALRDAITGVVERLAVTEDEYFGALEWLNDVGAAKEMILLSDVLHVSSFVVDVNHRHDAVTESTVLGPFYVPENHKDVGNPGRICPQDQEGTPMVVAGTVTDVGGDPLAGVRLDFWQSDASGRYDVQYPGDVVNLRGRMYTDAEGRYELHSIVPEAYPVPTDGPTGQLMRAIGRGAMRPAHLHVFAVAEGFVPKITHMFVEGSSHLDDDAVNGVKRSLIRRMNVDDDGVARTTFDVVLAPGS